MADAIQTLPQTLPNTGPATSAEGGGASGSFSSDETAVNSAARNPSNFDLAVDSTAMAGGSGGSVWDDAANLATKGLPLVARSMYLSFKNMPADVGNWLGMNNHIETMQELLGDSSNNKDLQQYYGEHAQGIDATAIIAGSFLPGMLASKMTSAGKIVSAIKAGKQVGDDINFAMGLLPAIREAKVLAEATAEIANNVTVYSSIAADTMKASMLGIADQALQAAAWEAATIATMHSNPSLNNDGFVDSLDHVFWGGITGGLFGSPFAILGARNTLRAAQAQYTMLEAGKQVLTKQGAGQFLVGDKIAQTLAAVWESEAMDAATTAAGKNFSEARAQAVRLDAIQQLNKVSDDSDVSNAMFDWMYKAKQQGMPLVGEGQNLGILDYMMQSKGVARVNNPEFLTADPDAFYLNIHTKETAGPPDAPNYLTGTYDAAAQYSHRVKFAEGFDPNNLKIAAFGDPMSPQIVAAADSLAPSAQSAWDHGFHLWTDNNGRLFINPESIGKDGPVFKKLPLDTQLDPEVFKQFKTTGKLPDDYPPVRNSTIVLNTKTGDATKDVWPTIGDIATAKFVPGSVNKLLGTSPVKLANDANSLDVAGKVYDYGLNKVYDATTASNLEANGRFAWAYLRGLKAGDTVASTDLPSLEAAVYQLKGLDQEAIDKLRLGMKLPDGSLSEFPTNLDSLQQHVVNLKQSILRDLTADGQPVRDAQDLATRVNAPIDWIKSGGAAGDFSQLSINPAEHLQLSHVRVNYAVSPVSFDSNADVARGIQAMQYRIDNIKELTQNVAGNFFKGAAQDIILGDTDLYNSAKAVGAQRTSSTFLGRADGDYSTLANRLQYSAKVLQTELDKAVDADNAYLTPHFHALMADDVAASNLAALRNAHLRMQEKFAFLPVEYSPSLKAQVEQLLGRDLAKGESILVPRKSMGTDAAKNFTWNADYKPKLADNAHDANKWVSATQLGKMSGGATALEGQASSLGMYTVPQKVADFLKTQQDINDARLIHSNNYFAAIGSSRKLETGNVYFPPVNTRNYPFVAFVKTREGLGGGTNSSAAILGRDADDLAQKIDLVKANHPELDVFSQGQSKEYFKARGDYDYNLNMTDNDVDTMLHRGGTLVDYVPNMNPKTTLADYAEWNKNQTTRLYRNYAELANGQLYSELDMMGKQYDWIANSRIGSASGTTSSAATAINNPYQNLKFQGLGINPRVGYTLWNDSQDKLESLFSTAFSKAKSAFGDASKGLIDFQQANDICKQYGLGDPFGTTMTAMRNYQVAGTPPITPMLEKFVRVANSVQTALSIRLDAMQALVNTISTPILMWPEALDAAKKLGVTELPGGSGVNVLGLTKLLGQSIQNWHSTEPAAVAFKQALFDKGILNLKPSSYFDLMNSLTLYGNESAGALADKMSSATNQAAKLIGSNFSEQFGRFMAADVARTIFGDAAGQEGEELWSNIHTFTSRVHGTTIASQRPVAFQGPIGAAIGLFQTYQFNFMQNTFRYVGEGNYKALALLAGLQTTMYGMQGLPGFNFINQTIIGNAMNNPAHSDIYSGSKSMLGDTLGNWALYGGASNLLQSGLYTRGDVNPRSMTILPVNPLDIPTVSSGIRAVQNLYDMTRKIHNGDDLWDTFTVGLEHNALSRPVSGLGQLMQGFSTTSQGSLISANQAVDLTGQSDFFNIANSMKRLVGARPLDEAVIMDAAFRRTAYQAADTDRMEALGAAVKDSIRKGAVPSDDQMNTFVGKYVAAGGYPANFGKAMVDWTKDANTSVANEVYRKLQTPAIQNLQKVMGGKMLPDYSMAPISAGVTIGGASTQTAGISATQNPSQYQPTQ